MGAPRTTAQTEGAAEPGVGQAQAQMVQIDPRSAQLSFGIRFGPTVADHRNQVARATAQSTDYGLIGGSLTGEGCSGGAPAVRPDQLPQVMRADSREPDHGTERFAQEGPVTQSVLATDRPFAQATSRLADLELPAILRVTGAYDRSTSGLDDDGRPIATAEVEIATLSLAGDLVELRGLRWEAVHTAAQEPYGSFTIGSASIAGSPLPTEDAAATVSAINDVLAAVGLVLAPPIAHLNEGVLFVDPLSVGIAPNPARDQAAAAILAAIQPLREQVFGALLEASCDFAAAITVIDILLGSVSGGGSLTVQLGGVQANTGQPDGFDGLGQGGTPPSVGGPTGSTLPAPRTDAGLPPPVAPSRVGAPTAPALGSSPAAATHTPSDGALAVGLVTVALGVALVEGDRRKMRRAAPASADIDSPGLEAT